MRARLAAILLASAAFIVPAAALAQPTTDFPLANPTFDGSETILGSQDGKTVLFTPADVAEVFGTIGTSGATLPLLSTANTASQPWTFPNLIDTGPATHSVLLGEGSSNVAGVGPALSGLCFLGNGVSADPSFQTCPGSPSVAHSWTAEQSFEASTTANAGVNLGQGTGPTSPANGDIWVTSSGVFARVNGSTAALGVTVPTAAAAGSAGQVQYYCSAVLCGATGMTFSGTTLTLPTTVNLIDGGSLTAALNTFGAPVYASGENPGFVINSGGAHYGCAYATGANAYALGFTSTVTSACSNPVYGWSDISGALSATISQALTVNATSIINDATGANLVAQFSYGSHALWTLPASGFVAVGNGGEGLSEDGAGFIGVGTGPADSSAGMKMRILTLNSGGELDFPDGGQCNGTSRTDGICKIYSALQIRGTLAPTLLSSGDSRIWNSNVAWTAGDADGGKRVGVGLVIESSANNNCNTPTHYPYCDNFSTVFVDSLNDIVLNIQAGGGNENFVGIGANRIMLAPAGGSSETAQQGTQLYLGDAYVGPGHVTAPKLLFGVGDVVNDVIPSFGQRSVQPIGAPTIANDAIRFGTTGNNLTVYDDRDAFQPAFSTEGALEFGRGNGSAAQYSGGVGVDWELHLRDLGGVLRVTNTAESASLGMRMGFNRLDGVLVSALSTADPSPVVGDRLTVTDATACTFGSTVTGSGATPCPLYYDGSAWKAG